MDCVKCHTIWPAQNSAEHELLIFLEGPLNCIGYWTVIICYYCHSKNGDVFVQSWSVTLCLVNDDFDMLTKGAVASISFIASILSFV